MSPGLHDPSLSPTSFSRRWADGELLLDTGQVFRDGALFDESGERQEIERPLQVFTRWYGFALTFPETEIYEP